jgi:6-phosphogluconolactonase (cycloisomerase 2 family)
LAALRISRFTFMDSIHACQLSDDQRLLFTANRGMNHITIYNYPDLSLRLRVNMPDIRNMCPWLVKQRIQDWAFITAIW